MFWYPRRQLWPSGDGGCVLEWVDGWGVSEAWGVVRKGMRALVCEGAPWGWPWQGWGAQEDQLTA